MSRVEQLLGRPVSIEVRDGVPADGAYDCLAELDRRFNPGLADSQVCRLERGELAELPVDLAEVLGICAYYERLTGGAFSARTPGGRLDPGPAALGWAVRRAADRLRAGGSANFCLNAGGDVLAVGEPEPGRPWVVGIRHPELADRVCAVLGVRDLAVATRVPVERGPGGGLLAVSVVAADLITAGVVAAAAYALGPDGVSWADSQPGCLVFAVDAEHVVHRSAALDELIVVEVS
ncbi:FAD:protein FMN transferase [Kutzneria viridogrisea]|uniref:FAD:protein FMN transferase n=1 Tax=Kutzneria viridogrisea TaxID=47990 RepID=A0ABR6BW90_9PSEU|nr:thiamine biosynthesis lipoprotein [Kutzneria viridogrisea]